MKGVDTNLLVRFLVNDDQRQAATVRQLLQRCEAEKSSLFVPLPVVLELLWVLDAAYGVGREELITALEDLLAMPVFEFDRQPAVRAFLLAARRSDGDLSDLLIAHVAADAGCDTLLTFDRRAARHELFELL